MKLLLIVTFIILFSTVNATTYYFSTSGSDANNGTTTGTPWKTLSKFNSSIASAVTGDIFLFKRGDTFYGSIKINKAGASGNPITLGAYGTGANPIITGFTTISAWTNLGSNIWESTTAVSTLSTANMVVINGVNVAMGRYPNTGYLTYTAPTTTTKNVSSLNSATTNWTGAVAVMRLHHWIMDNNLITAHSGSTITHNTTPNPTSYPGISGYGLFIQNDGRTLDQQNEWYYNPTNKKLLIYSNGTPPAIQVSTIDTLVWMPKVGAGYVTVENIKFTGSNMKTFAINGTPNVTIQNCQFDFAGQDVIWGGQNWGSPFSPNFVFKNNTVNHTNNNVIYLASDFTNALIQNNTFDNTALQAGMGKGGDEQMMVIRLAANDGIIEYNTIDSSGYIPINIAGNNIQVRYNFITRFNMTKMDGGGIYSYVGSGSTKTGVRIHHNIVLNSYPSTSGTSQSVGLGHGIYLDENVDNFQIDSNTVANVSHSCLYINLGASGNNIFGNTFYNGDVAAILQTRAVSNTLTNNIFFAKAATQKVQMVTTNLTASSYFSTMGTFTNNYYARPIDDSTATNTFFVQSSSGFNNWNLTQWKSGTVNDVGSVKSPKSITTVNDLRFEYNATSVNKTITLDTNYIDVKNLSYNGTITLAPFTSLVLIKSDIGFIILPSNEHSGVNRMRDSISDINIYPNPASTLVNITTKDFSNIRIINSAGQTMKEFSTGKKTTTLPLHYPAGVYVVQITDTYRTRTKKLIIIK